MTDFKNKALFRDITLSFTVDGCNREFLEFIHQQSKKNEIAQKTLGERIDQLIKNNFDLESIEDDTLESIHNIFMAGYVFGWNDYKAVIEDDICIEQP